MAQKTPGAERYPSVGLTIAVALLASVGPLGCTSERLDPGMHIREAPGRLESCTEIDTEGMLVGGVTWHSTIVGDFTTGSACYDSATGSFVVESNGQGPLRESGQQDMLQFVYANLADIPGVGNGDVEVVLRLREASNETTGLELLANAGVMIRDGNPTDSGAEYHRMATGWYAQDHVDFFCSGATTGVVSAFLKSVRADVGSNAPTTHNLVGRTRVVTPLWLRLQRIGNDFSISRRRDDGPWVPLSGGIFRPETESVSVGFFASRVGATGAGVVASFDNVYVGPVRADYASSWIGSTHVAHSTGILSHGMDAFYVAPDGTSYKYFADRDPASHMIQRFDSDGELSLVEAGGFQGSLQGGITGNGAHVYAVTSNANTVTIGRAMQLRSFDPTSLAEEWQIDLGEIVVGGIAADSEKIYVSDRTTGSGRVRIFDIFDTEHPETHISFTNPGPLAVEDGERLWIAQTVDYPSSNGWNFNLNANSSIHCIDLAAESGLACPQNPALTGLDNPTALATAPSGTPRLLIALNGDHRAAQPTGPKRSQNIQICEIQAPSLNCSEFGQPGGIFAGSTPGLVNDPTASGPRFFSPIGVGMDSQGMIYVASSAPRIEIQKFSPEGAPQWLHPPRGFSPEPGGFDPATDGEDFYTLTRHMGLSLSSNLSGSAPGSEWISRAVTWDPAADLDQDTRFTRGPTGPSPGAPLIRNIPVSVSNPNGAKRRFMFVPGTTDVRIYRFLDEGEIAKPCGLIELHGECLNPSDPEHPLPCLKLWLDLDGDGVRNDTEQPPLSRTGSFAFDVDARGDIWLASTVADGILRLQGLGVNEWGTPLYDLDAEPPFNTPAPFGGTGHGSTYHVRHDVRPDEHTSLYLYGFVPSESEAQCGAGGKRLAVVRYDDFGELSQQAYAPFYLPDAVLERHQPHDFGTLYWDEACGCGASCANPEPCSTDWPYKSFDVEGSYFFLQEFQGPIHVYDATTGEAATRLFAGPELSGDQDTFLTFGGMQAFRRSSNGEYLVTTTDKSIQARTLLFRWVPEWTPMKLSPSAWYFVSPDDVVMGSGGAVSQWSDRSGNDNHVVQTLAPYQPVYLDTGWNAAKPTIRFSATSAPFVKDPWPTANPLGLEAPYTILVVMQAAEIESGAIVSWWGEGGLVGAWLEADQGSLFLTSRRAGDETGDVQFTGVRNISTDRHVLAYRYDGAGTFTLTVDHYPDETSTVSTVSTIYGGSGNNMLLIGWQDGWATERFRGDISELVVIPEAISDDDVRDFREYAQREWGGLVSAP